jgi:metallo-beta-lactamase family protein
MEWLKAMNQLPEQLFLVHGEPSAQNSFRVKIQDELGLNVVIPSLYEEIQF